MTFENGEHYSFKQLKSMHNNKKQYKIIGAYNDSHKICGYIIVTISDKIDIDKIYTDILYRHYGVGEGLIKYVSNKYNGKKLILEVSSTNTNAIQFYKKIRFVKVGLRKNYYGDGDHAIVLQK
jgi:ribosomal-protein-alanine N-acetyltransferase